MDHHTVLAWSAHGLRLSSLLGATLIDGSLKLFRLDSILQRRIVCVANDLQGNVSSELQSLPTDLSYMRLARGFAVACTSSTRQAHTCASLSF